MTFFVRLVLVKLISAGLNIKTFENVEVKCCWASNDEPGTRLVPLCWVPAVQSHNLIQEHFMCASALISNRSELDIMELLLELSIF